MGADVGRWVSWYRTLRACTCIVWISWYRILRVRIYSVRILVSVALLVSVIIQMSSLGRAADGQHNYPVYLNCHLAHLASSPIPPSSITQTLFPLSTDYLYTRLQFHITDEFKSPIAWIIRTQKITLAFFKSQERMKNSNGGDSLGKTEEVWLKLIEKFWVYKLLDEEESTNSGLKLPKVWPCANV